MSDEPCMVRWYDGAGNAHVCASTVHYSTPHACTCGATR